MNIYLIFLFLLHIYPLSLYCQYYFKTCSSIIISVRYEDLIGSISIVTTFKLEACYLEEWINYHLNIGFDHFYLYDNNDGNTDDILIIEKLKNSSISKHISFYNARNIERYNRFYLNIPTKMLESFNKEDWLFVNLNIDEFLTFPNNSKNGKNIREYLKNAVKNKCDVVCFNWQVHGNNGHHYQTQSKVLDRFPLPTLPLNFTKYGRIENTHTKCIGHGKLGTNAYIHDILINKSKGQKSCNGDLLPGKSISLKYEPFLEEMSFNSAYIRHFFTKSTEEWYKYKMKKVDYEERYGWDNFNQINKHSPNKPFNPDDNYTFL